MDAIGTIIDVETKQRKKRQSLTPEQRKQRLGEVTQKRLNTVKKRLQAIVRLDDTTSSHLSAAIIAVDNTINKYKV